MKKDQSMAHEEYGEKIDEEVEQQLKELEEYKRQKEIIRQIVGSLGGVSTLKHKIANALFLLLVLATFALSIFTEGVFHMLALEIGILLISLKIAYFLYNEARVNHFQFWILSSIEWQANNLERRFRDMNRKLDALTAALPGEKQQDEPAAKDEDA